MMSSILKTFISLLGLVVLIGMGVYSLEKKDFFNIQKIEIQIKNSNSLKTIEPKVQNLRNELEGLKKFSLYEVNVYELTQKIEAKEWVREVFVTKRWPQTVFIEVFPKDFGGIFLGSDGRFYPVAEGGEFLEPVSFKNLPDQVILRGADLKDKVELRKKAVRLLSQLPTEGKLSQKTISEVTYKPKDGFWISLIESELRVRMGEDEFIPKIQRVTQVLDYMEAQKISGKVIDARFSSKILVRTK